MHKYHRENCIPFHSKQHYLYLIASFERIDTHLSQKIISQSEIIYSRNLIQWRRCSLCASNYPPTRFWCCEKLDWPRWATKTAITFKRMQSVEGRGGREQGARQQWWSSLSIDTPLPFSACSYTQRTDYSLLEYSLPPSGNERNFT